jgi:hypothetical protein
LAVYHDLIGQGMYYKDAHLEAYGRKARETKPTSAPDPGFEWPDTGWLTHSFGVGDIPHKMIVMAALYACIAIALVVTFCFAEWGFPHGPKVFTGELREVCQGDRRERCIEMPVYKEDTSNLDNPKWVGLIRSAGLLVLLPGIICGIAMVYKGSEARKRLKDLKFAQYSFRVQSVFPVISLRLSQGVEVHGDPGLWDAIAHTIAEGESRMVSVVENGLAHRLNY